MPRHIALCLAAFSLLPGCEETAAPTPPAPRVQADTGTAFTPETAGSLTGQVTWRGGRPVVPPFRSIENPLSEQPQVPRDWPNPNAPVLDAAGGLARTVVYLRGVEPRQARVWHHAPVQVELHDYRFRIRQGERPVPIGFVRAGDAITITSRQSVYHSVQGRGSNFFALGIPDPGRVHERRLIHPGIVELSSGAGLFWMRAYLFVSEHPYCTRTARNGRYRLESIPPGEYEVVAWHPSWQVAREERNPDNFRLQQVRFRPPFLTCGKVKILPGQTASLDLHLDPGSSPGSGGLLQ